jgi:C_GCAxxG_C_C family probable redox protein
MARTNETKQGGRMSESEKAVEATGAGYNCAQAISTTYGTQFGVPEETISRISSAFGSGIGRTDNICGAVSGAVMVLGLKFGARNASEKEAKTKASIIANEFIQEFKRRYGEVSCTRLVGYNLSIPSEMKKAVAEGAFATCRDIVRHAGELLEEYLERS